MDLFTTQISKRFQVHKRRIVFVDTTVMSGTQMFAPTWELVTGIKCGDLNQETYTQEYLALMRRSYQKNRNKWHVFLTMEEPLAIACYCSPGQFCHRHLLKDIFEQLCRQQKLPFLYYGELE